QREYWLSDASSLFGAEFNIVPINEVDFNASELRRFEKGNTVVRYVAQPIYADVYYRLPDNQSVLTASISQVTEQQVRAIAVFLLDDLSYYATLSDKRARLAELEEKFSFLLVYRCISTLHLVSSK